MKPIQSRILAVALLSALAPACSKQERPLTASSAGQKTYALGYVDSLVAVRGEVAAIESQVAAAEKDFAGYPNALSNPSWPDVLAVYEAADAAGRSSDFVEEVEKDRVVAQFYVEEKDELNRKVGGAAQYAAKQKECDVELSGPTSYALGKAIDERMRERMRKHSEAYAYLDEHEEVLGKRNRPKLEDQSDAIAQTSYFVFVGAPKLKQRLEAQVNEASTVDKTLQRVAEESHKVATDEKTPAAQKSKAQAREAAAIAARQRLAPEANEAKKLSDEMDKRVAALRDRYKAAFEALTDAVEQREKAEKAK